MTQQELVEWMAHLAEMLQGQHIALSVELPKNAEGFLIPDGSDLFDALRVIEHAVSALSRMVYKIGKEGIQP